jgi:hypothetical protein
MLKNQIMSKIQSDNDGWAQILSKSFLIYTLNY